MKARQFRHMAALLLFAGVVLICIALWALHWTLALIAMGFFLIALAVASKQVADEEK